MRLEVLGGFQSLFPSNSSEGFRRSACWPAVSSPVWAQARPCFLFPLSKRVLCVPVSSFICSCTRLEGLCHYLQCTHAQCQLPEAVSSPETLWFFLFLLLKSHRTSLSIGVFPGSDIWAVLMKTSSELCSGTENLRLIKMGVFLKPWAESFL